VSNLKLKPLKDVYPGATDVNEKIKELLKNNQHKEIVELSGIIDMTKEESSFLPPKKFKEAKEKVEKANQKFVENSRENFKQNELDELYQNKASLERYCLEKISNQLKMLNETTDDNIVEEIHNHIYVLQYVARMCSLVRNEVFEQIMNRQEGFTIATLISRALDDCFLEGNPKAFEWHRGEVLLEATTERKREELQNNKVNKKADAVWYYRDQDRRKFEIVIHEAKKMQSNPSEIQLDYIKLQKACKGALIRICENREIERFEDICIFGIQTIGSTFSIFKLSIECCDVVYWSQIDSLTINKELSTSNIENMVKLARIMIEIKKNQSK
jgi:hypothetical protein